jgi:hypothetical protein
MVVQTNLCSQLMELANIHHEMDWSDFDDVVKFLEANLDAVIAEVHGLDKLLIDDGKVQLNCPPPPEAGDSHGHLLLRTLSEKVGDGGITLKREFKVHSAGPDPDDANRRMVEIREDVVKAPDTAGEPPVQKENVVTVSI